MRRAERKAPVVTEWTTATVEGLKEDLREEEKIVEAARLDAEWWKEYLTQSAIKDFEGDLYEEEEHFYEGRNFFAEDDELDAALWWDELDSGLWGEEFCL